jgi:hypothetical protein
MYVPKDANGKLPAIAVSGPFGAVKEQVSGLYAQTLAERGFLTIAFDPSFTGESGGEPRQMASPDINTEDFLAAVGPRIKATVTSTMYDMSRVVANGYFDDDDSKEKRDAQRKAIALQRTVYHFSRLSQAQRWLQRRLECQRLPVVPQPAHALLCPRDNEPCVAHPRRESPQPLFQRDRL